MLCTDLRRRSCINTYIIKIHTLIAQANFFAALARRPEARILAVDMEASHLDYIRCALI